MKRLLILLGAALLLAACPSTTAPAKRYPLHGQVKALDEKGKTATIQHEKIGDWMDAMTMEFPVKPDTEFQKLKVGQTIDATVVVSDDKYYVTEIKVAGS
jgi:Cu/Ag efflux protein CusF